MRLASANRIAMYERHFGLKKRIFRASAVGADVFVGPQTTRTIAGLRNALDAPDAVAIVTGQVGVGKTTVVTRALSTLGDSRVQVTVGRIQLDHDEVLEYLLNELGTGALPIGTVQRFSLFRRTLKDFSDKGTRVFIVVEDAGRTGLDALSELEALTAADAGVSDGANIVLMGEPGIIEQMKAPGLARLKQRIRLSLPVLPLGETELVAYLKHCFHLTGADYDNIFADGTSHLLHQLSGGIPRVANNLVETILGCAVDHNLDCITPEFITTMVADECGMAVQPASLSAAARISTDPVVAPRPAASLVIDSEDEEPIRELTQNTLPNLEILAPALAAMPTPAELKAEPVSEPTPEPETNPMPEFDVKQDDAPLLVCENSDVADEKDVPAWERDPTIAQLKPDFDALERAMAANQDESAESDVPVEAETYTAAAASAVIPEITLDRTIKEKIDQATELLKNTTSDLADMAAADLRKISTDLAKAKTLSDVDDKMAETIFGQDFSEIEAQITEMVAANPPIDDLSPVPAKDDLRPDIGEAKVAASPATAAASAVSAPKATISANDNNTDFTASALHRLAMVRALNENNELEPEPGRPVLLPLGRATSSAPTTGEQPASIEDQINTTMTQALDTLNVPPQPTEDDDEDTGGFFRSFRRPDSA